MSITLENSIWPNAGGTLGEIKTQIPDGVTIKWPDGDALVGNFVYQNGKLVGFVDTKALTVNDSGSTTIDYDYTNIELPFAEDAMTINRGPRSKYLFIKFNDKEVEEGDILDSITLVDTLDLKIAANSSQIPEAGSEYIDSLIIGDEVEFKFDTDEYLLWTTKNNTMSTPAIMNSSILGIGNKNCDNHLDLIFDNDSNITKNYCKYTFTESCPGGSGATTIQLPNTAFIEGEGMCLAGIRYLSLPEEGIAKLKYLKIDNLVDMVPAVHKDGRKGMYCKIRNIFIPVKTI